MTNEKECVNNNQELFSKISCALTHDLRVCDDCKKCEGNNFAEIRLNLIKELAKELNIDITYKDQ